MNRVVLPEHWQWSTLGEICEPPQYGWTTKATSSPGTVRLLRTTDISSGTITWDSVPYCTDDPPNIDAFALKPGDLVVSRAGSVGISMLIGECPEAVFASYLIRFRAEPSIDPRYVAYFFKSPLYWREIASRSLGIALMNVNASKLRTVPLPVAPLAEQQRIVAEIEKQFTRLDAAVAGLERVRANLKRYRAATLAAAYQGRLTFATRRSHSGSWESVELGSLLTEIRAGRSFRCEERLPGAGEIGVVKVSAVSWGEYDETESKTCIEPARANPAFFVRQGDFLFSRANTIQLVGACVIAKHVSKTIMLSDKILRLTFRDNVLPSWVLWFLRSALGRVEIERFSTGNQDSMRNIGQDRIRRITMPLPSLVEQQRIVDEIDRRLSLVDKLEDVVDDGLRRAASLRQSILTRAFEGKLVPQDPNDEPASMLLERIRTERAAQVTNGKAPVRVRGGKKVAVGE